VTKKVVKKKTARRSPDAVLKELRKFGLAYPEAHTKSPWPRAQAPKKLVALLSPARKA